MFDRPEWRLAIALCIGLVVGAERERHKGQGNERASAGVRTFALVALLGALVADLGTPGLLVVVGGFVAAAALVSYAMGSRQDPGLTSEVAMMVTFVLGVISQTHPARALGTGVLVAVILARRTQLHTFVREVLTEQELLDALTFAVAAVVILPLAPNRTIDPFGALNPFTLWRLAVVMMGLSSVGYVAQRALGARYGLALSGLASGFISSSATVAAMGTRARTEAELAPAAAAGAAMSSVATFIQMAILVGTASPALLVRVAIPLGLGGAGAAGYGLWLTWRAVRAHVPEGNRGRPFNLASALLFSVLVTAVALIAALIQRWLGAGAALAVAGVAGFADAHAAAASVASLDAAGKLTPLTSVLGILAALTTNTATKLVLALTAGPRSYAARVGVGLGVMLAASWLGFALLLPRL